MRKILALVIIAGLLIAAVPALSPRVEAAVYDYQITSVMRTGSDEVTVRLQVRFCSGCNPNYLSSPGCYAFTHGYPPPSYPYRHWCGGLVAGRYVAVRLKDESGSIIGTTQKLVCNQANWPINQLITRDFVFSGISLQGSSTVTAEADVYCSWCGHWYPSPRNLEVGPLRVCIDPGHGGVDWGEVGYGDSRHFQYPLADWDVVQEFGNWYAAWGGYHLGEDIPAAGGTEVYAAADGVAKFAAVDIGGYGGVIIIEHPLPDSSKVCAVYGHLSKKLGLKVSTKPGQNSVKKGQLIGYVAYDYEDGGPWAPHLHFGVREGPYVAGNVYYIYSPVTGTWRWTWAYMGYTRNANLTQTTKTDYDVTHDQMKEMWWNPYEKNFNLDIALRARDCLESKGIEVVMTRTKDTDVTLQPRCDIANNHGCAVFVSIHSNSHADWSATGSEAFYLPGSIHGFDLGSHVQSELTKQIGLPNLGVKARALYVLEHTKMPGCSTEVAGVNNQWEFSLLNDPAFRQRAAEGIANGILAYLDWKGLTVTAKCPVDLLVTDPDGLRICKDFTEIPGASYLEIDLNGEPGIRIRIPDRKIGDYLIEVIPKPGALPTDTFTLEISLFGESMIIARNVLISNIPPEPYKVVSTETQLFPPTIPAEMDFDPDVLNLRTRGGVVTAYIELPEGYDVGQIDVSSIRLNDTVSALEWPYEVGDYNRNGIPDLMVKFDSRAVQAILEVGQSGEITITGEVGGIPFMGTDTIRVIDPTWYSLEISSTTGGSVTVPGEGTFSYKGGTVVSLVATPVSDCYSFAYWTGDVGTIADVSAPSTTITMQGDCSIIANFEERAVAFPDPNLEAVIREAIDKPTGDIYLADLEGLTELWAEDRNIGDLTGMEHCVGLTRLWLPDNQISAISALETLTSLTLLDLGHNQISDISPLEGLTNLTWLWLVHNPITDISPLASLNSLTRLYFFGNQISDISPLAGLTNLEELRLHDNQISDISPVTNLTSLTSFGIQDNQITDISPLDGLTNLTELWLAHNEIGDVSPLASLNSLTRLSLAGNQISDIRPLVDNPGLGEGDEVWLQNNPLSEQSMNEYIPILQARGVLVSY